MAMIIIKKFDFELLQFDLKCFTKFSDRQFVQDARTISFTLVNECLRTLKDLVWQLDDCGVILV